MRILVTGAGGFLGLAISRALRERGDDVVGVNRRHYPVLGQIGVQQFQFDLGADYAALLRAAKGCDAIIHVAAKAGAWGRYADYYQANVVATENVIQVCRELGIGKLVYTSTPSVAHAGGDLAGVDESAPYPRRYHAHYPATKAIAERLVLAANSPHLTTVALRPHLIFGPGDNHLYPRLVDRARRGKLAFIGRTSKLIDVVYIDNAVDAHLAALDRANPNHVCAGKAYFISNDEPIALDLMVNAMLARAGIAPVRKRIPFALAYAVGALMEAWHTLRGRSDEPMMTRFVAEQLATAHWYNISAAKRDLGYAPRVSIAQGLLQLSSKDAG
jgi:2-alkyl-3-oxoalkanoate reductase